MLPTISASSATLKSMVPITGTWLTGCTTVKLLLLVAVFPPTVTLTLPVVAPSGTVMVSLVAVGDVTVAVVVPILTVLEAAVVLKLVPLMVTMVPTGPEVGLKPVMVGVSTVGVLGPSSLLQDQSAATAKSERANFLSFIVFIFKVNGTRCQIWERIQVTI